MKKRRTKAQKKSEKKAGIKTRASRKGRTKKAAKLSKSEVKKRVVTIISEVLNITKKNVIAANEFQSGLGMDSMGALEILAAIETTFKIEIPEESLSEVVNLDSLIDLTTGLLAKRDK